MDRSEKNAEQPPKDAAHESKLRRLDAVAAEAGGVSRRRAQRLIADGAVMLNGRLTSARDKGRMVGPDDVVTLSADIGRVAPQPEMPLVELENGPGWVAVDKPAGVPVHPLHEGETGTLLNAVAARYPQVQGVGTSGGEGGLKSGVVHRLDTETSGVLLVALEETAWQRYRQAFAEHRTTKIYMAVVEGQPEAAGRAELDLAVTRHRPAHVEVVKPTHHGARRCDLAWRVEQTNGHASLLRIELGTGFLHQIRATFHHLGHPILGDQVYTSGPTGQATARLMLHAHRLKLEEIDVNSPVPAALSPLPETMG